MFVIVSPVHGVPGRQLSASSVSGSDIGACVRHPWLSACRLPLLRQGLSDFRTAELPGLGGMLDDRCPLYRLKKDDTEPGGEGGEL